MNYEEQIKLLQEENTQLRALIRLLEENIGLQKEENRIQREMVIKLEKRIAELEELLRRAGIKKHSGNSSLPPSSDLPGRTRSLRHKSGKKPGGQPGHKGTTLRMTDTPDQIIDLKPNQCERCGCNLDHVRSYRQSSRQVIDISPVQAWIKEYRNYYTICPGCGNCQRSQYPASVSNNIQYGENIEAIVSYLSVRQYLPFRRLKELFHHVFSLEISEGTVNNILNRMSGKALAAYDEIKQTITKSEQVGSDETSAKVNGKNCWIWVWQTLQSTFLAASNSRGSETIDKLFPDGFPNSILSSDRWSAQLNTKAKDHQLCLAHILRNLKLIQELEDNQFSYAMEAILKEAMDLKDEQPQYSRSDQRIMEIEECLDILLNENIPKASYPKTHTLLASLIKHRDSILTFLYNQPVPPDNNGSERAIRNVKVKQKVSGQFKSNENVFCILRSVIDTCIKRGVDIFSTLKSIAQLLPAE